MELVILGLINEGSYGKVYKSLNQATGKLYAVKERKFHQKEENYGIPPDIMREIVILKKLSHPNIIRPVQVEIDNADKKYKVVLEYFEHDLLDLINMYRASNHKIPMSSIKKIIKQLLQGIEYLHSNLIVHRDLKPSNILVTKDLHVTIADFGFAKQFNLPLRILSKRVGTLTYKAPEMLVSEDIDYGPSIDIWAIGCIMINLLIRDKFIECSDEYSLLINIISVIDQDKFAECDLYKEFLDGIKGLGPLSSSFKLTQLNKILDTNGYDLICKLMEPNPFTRIEAIEALRHPWLND